VAIRASRLNLLASLLPFVGFMILVLAAVGFGVGQSNGRAVTAHT
jgi:hypothetical protein